MSDIEQSTGPSAEDDIGKSLPLSLLQRLLLLIQVSVAPGKLEQAWSANTQGIMGPVSLPQRIQLLAQALQLRGLRVAQLRWARMDQRRLPALMHWQGEWWLAERQLLEQPTTSASSQAEDSAPVDWPEDGVIPASHEISLTGVDGVAHLHAPEVLEDGVVLWLDNPAAKAQEKISLTGSRSIRLVVAALLRRRRWIGHVVVATLVINLMAVATSLFAMQVYDRVVPTLAWATLWTLVVGMVIVLLLDWGLKILRGRVLDSVACEVDQRVSQQVFDHLLHLQMDTRPRSLGTIAAQVSGLESVRHFFSSGVFFTLVDTPFALLFIVFIAMIGGPVAWVYTALLPVAVLLGWLGQRSMRRLMKDEMQRSNERQGLLVDSIQGAETIRAANASWRFSEIWQSISETVAGFGIQHKALNNLIQLTTASLSQVAYVAAVVVGVYEVAEGHMTIGAMIACSILGGRVIAPVSQAVRYMAQWENVQQSLKMVDQVLDLDTERRAEQSLLMPSEPPAEIALQAVSFSYPDSPVLQLDVGSLSLKAGDRVAVVGQIGSGKSTLLKILAGLYRPSAGRVRLGQGDLWEMDPAIVAQQVGYLPQSVHLFKGSLRSNLILGGAIADGHLLEVAQQLGIDRIAADSPYSMDLPISEGGDGLSGGQKQLVGMARVVLARPTIWLLDEPTASLDPDTEQQVLTALESHLKPSDILVVSTHKPALASRLARRVLLMQQGRIVRDDSPEAIFQRQRAPSGTARRPPAGGPINVI
jgi:ATP-binding cassette subfamily C protein LapB